MSESSKDYVRGLKAKAVKSKPRNPLADCDRITANFTIVHERCGDQPKTAGFQFSRPAQTLGEQMFSLEVILTTEWQSLDFAWLNGKVGYLVVESLAGKNLRVNPEYVETEMWDRQVISLVQGGATKGFIVRRNRGFAGELDPDAAGVRMKVSEGTVRVRVTGMPR